ncbi:MAG: sugar transferase [Phycisphaerales bacterium]
MTLAELKTDRRVCAEIRRAAPRLWGMTPVELHDDAWRQRGVQVVRRGAGQRVEPGPRYLLLDRAECVQPDLVLALAGTATPRGWLRRRRSERSVESRWTESAASDLGTTREHHERVLLADDGRLVRIERRYTDAAEPRRARITGDRRAAGAWAADHAANVDPKERSESFPETCLGNECSDLPEAFAERVLDELARGGRLPGGVRAIAPGVWAHESARIDAGARFIGPVWIGRGARIGADATVVGPCIVPDGASSSIPVRPETRRSRPDDGSAVFGTWGARTKRLFDVAASLFVLGVTLPISAVIVVAIWMQAGRPILFANERQTKGGRTFRCLKFRTMRRDAEQVKASFTAANTCDGPQFHIPNDPRTFPVGRVLRRCHLDELPQLINVLRGDMSIVGPRPSPDNENQCCPVWRRERLSVRAGITGNWQVNCKRLPGTDFQEWIRYDLEYVRGWSWRLDCSIMCRTLVVAARRGAGLLLPAHRGTALRTPKASVYTPEGSAGVVEPKPERRAETAIAA